MKVKYTGKGDYLFTEYNGKRYVFSKKDPISEIPVEVWINLNQSGHVSRFDLIPYEEPVKQEATEVKEEEFEGEKKPVKKAKKNEQ